MPRYIVTVLVETEVIVEADSEEDACGEAECQTCGNVISTQATLDE